MNKLPLQPLSPVRRMLPLNVGGKNGFMGGALLYVTVWSHIDPLEHLRCGCVTSQNIVHHCAVANLNF